MQIGKLRHRVLLLPPPVVTDGPGLPPELVCVPARYTVFQREALPQTPSPLAREEVPASPVFLPVQPAQTKGPLVPGQR